MGVTKPATIEPINIYAKVDLPVSLSLSSGNQCIWSGINVGEVNYYYYHNGWDGPEEENDHSLNWLEEGLALK